MGGFSLDPRLSGDTLRITALGLCELLLMKDSRWPWLILVPKRPDILELHDLTPLDQTMLTFETTLVARGLKEATGAAKINIGALGNVVPMFHMHVVARSPGDANWPGPVWGAGAGLPYPEGKAEALADKLLQGVLAS